MHPNSQKNANGIKYHPGRPKRDQSIIDYMRSKLNEPCPYDNKVPQRTWLVALADAEMRESLNDKGARRDLLDRLCGRPVETVSSTGEYILRWVEDA